MLFSMRNLVNHIICLISLVVLGGGEIRAPPNVPPQHYQQYQQQQIPVHQQQQQQQFIQQPQYVQPGQQVPVQQVPVQQVPIQQVPVQQHVPVQHIPVQTGHAYDPQAHGHGHGHGDPKLLNTANLDQEKDHIKEHMAVPLDTSKMSEQELQFHYFKMHDADNNNKLDGCELIKSLIHWHEQGGRDHTGQQTPPQDKIFSDEELMQLIDPILQMDDVNGDGYIDYPEFVRAQQKAAAAQAQGQQRH